MPMSHSNTNPARSTDWQRVRQLPSQTTPRAPHRNVYDLAMHSKTAKWWRHTATPECGHTATPQCLGDTMPQGRKRTHLRISEHKHSRKSDTSQGQHTTTPTLNTCEQGTTHTERAETETPAAQQLCWGRAPGRTSRDQQDQRRRRRFPAQIRRDQPPRPSQSSRPKGKACPSPHLPPWMLPHSLGAAWWMEGWARLGTGGDSPHCTRG